MRRFFPSLRGLPRTYWFLWVGALINRLGGFVFPFLAIYLTEIRHLSVTTTGTIAGICGLGSFLSGPTGGWLADRLGRRPAMLIGLLLNPVALTALGFARTPHQIALAAFFYGFLGDLYRPVNQAMVADLIPTHDRPRAFGILYWAVNLGFAFATVIGGVMAHRNFEVLFVADAATTLAFAGLVWLKVPETRPAVSGGRKPLGLRGMLSPALDGRMMAFTGLAFLLGLLFLQCNVTLPIDMRAHGLSTDAYGALLAINGILIVALSPVAIALVPRFGRGRVLALAMLLVGLGFGANAFAHSVPLYAGAIAVWTMGEILQAPVMPAVVADLAPVDRRGTYQGFFMMAWGAAYFVAPTLGSFVLEHLGAQALWGACLGIGMLAAAGHLAFARTRRAPDAQALPVLAVE